ncbi:MAG: hypothetical protein CMM74_03050 [Rhodospirillaceae bacterium]|nr:hypothetical protein [Rhodospirillaceae bacterium]
MISPGRIKIYYDDDIASDMIILGHAAIRERCRDEIYANVGIGSRGSLVTGIHLAGCRIGVSET